MRRTPLIAIAAAAGLALLVALLVAWRTLDVDRYRGGLETALAERLGRIVSLGRMRATLIPFGVTVENVVIGENPAFQTGRPFAQAESLNLRPRLIALIGGRFEVRSLTLQHPVVELVRNADGKWNFATLGRADGRPGDLVVDRLAMASGEIAVTDFQRKAVPRKAAESGRVIYQNVDLELRHLAPGRPFDIVLATTLPNHGAQHLGLRGTAGPLARDDVSMTPFEGIVEFDRVMFSGLQQFLQLRALADSDATVSGSVSLRTQRGQMSSKGELRFEQPRVRGVDLLYPIGVAFDLAHDFDSGTLTVRSGTLRLDKTPLSVAGKVNLQPDTPILDLHATASDVSLAEAARLASAFGVAFGAGTHVQGLLTADVRARGSANQPELEGHVRLRDVGISGAGLPRPVRTPSVDLALTPLEIRSNDVSASTNGTSLAVRFVLSQYRTAKPAIDASIRTSGANFAEVVNIARAWGVRAVEGMSGTGRLALDVRAAGPLDDPAFSGTGSLDDATLKTGAIAQPIQVRHANLQFGGSRATAENVSVTIGKTNAEGRLTIRRFTAPQVDFEFAADRVDLEDMYRVFTPARKPQAPAQRRPTTDNVLLRTTGSGRLRAGSMTYGQLILDNVQTSAALDNGLIRLDSFNAGLFGGRHRGSIAIDLRRTPPVFVVASDIQRVDANRLATAVADMRDVIYGLMAAAAHMSFATDGTSNMASTLNGTLSLNVPNGRIAHMDVLHEVATIGQFVSGRPASGSSTSVTALSGSFKVSDGVAYTNNLVATIEGGRIGAAGTVNLLNQTLNLRMNVVLSRGFSRTVGGAQVGGFMGTVLANQQGELVIPVLVTGTLQQPRFAPDVQGIAEMKVRNLVPDLRDPQGLTRGLLGVLGGQPQGTSGEKGVGDILGVITGERPPQERQTPPTEPTEPRGKKPPAAAPPPKEPGQQQLEDALRKLLGGKNEKPPRK